MKLMLTRTDLFSSAPTPTPRVASASSPLTSTPSPGIAPSTSTASATSKMTLASLDPGPTSSTTSILPCPSGHVRLLFTRGPDTAELVATKAKGLPRITISLDRVDASALKDAIADFSFALYESYKTKQEHASREQDQVSQLMQSLVSEREKNEVMQKQLEALSFLNKRKATKPKLVTDQVPSVLSAPPSSEQIIVPAQQQTPVALPSKVPPAKATKRLAPVSRRARVRGALLHDTEENDDDDS